MIDKIDNENIKLHFIGAVDKNAVKEKMKESHIVIIPSMAEGLPNVLYEAMASGNMIIASNVGGIPEILEHGITGEFVPPNDPTALMKSILKSSSLDRYIEECAINGRKKIEEMDYSMFISGYLNIYMNSTKEQNH